MCTCSVMFYSLWPHGLEPTRLLCPWDSPSKNTGVGCHFLLQGIFPMQGSNLSLLCLLHCRQMLYHLSHQGEASYIIDKASLSNLLLLLLLLSHFSRVQFFVTLWTVNHQTPLSMGFSRQEYWSGLPFSSPGDLPNPGIKPGSPVLQADALNLK